MSYWASYIYICILLLILFFWFFFLSLTQVGITPTLMWIIHHFCIYILIMVIYWHIEIQCIKDIVFWTNQTNTKKPHLLIRWNGTVETAYTHSIIYIILLSYWVRIWYHILFACFRNANIYLNIYIINIWWYWLMADMYIYNKR